MVFTVFPQLFGQCGSVKEENTVPDMGPFGVGLIWVARIEGSAGEEGSLGGV